MDDSDLMSFFEKTILLNYDSNEPAVKQWPSVPADDFLKRFILLMLEVTNLLFYCFCRIFKGLVLNPPDFKY